MLAKGLITCRISARLTGLEKKNAITWEISEPGLKLNVRAGTVVFYIYCCTQGLHACVYQFSAQDGKVSARAEILHVISP